MDFRKWAMGEINRQLALLETEITGQEFYDALFDFQVAAFIAQRG